MNEIFDSVLSNVIGFFGAVFSKAASYSKELAGDFIGITTSLSITELLLFAIGLPLFLWLIKTLINIIRG